jgi:feruloyl-CoA synthase
VLSHPRDGAGGRRHLIRVERERDGTLRLAGEPLEAHADSLLALLDDAARRAPRRAFLIERDARDVWHEVSFATMAARSWRVGAALRALGASEDRPVMILSGNGIDHAMVTFGALRAGIPVVPVAASLGLSADDGFARLRAIAELVRPGVVFARDGMAYAAAAHAISGSGAAYVCVTEPPAGVRAFDYARLLTHAPLVPDAVAVSGETVAKVMLTTGSDGELRGVVTTHAMICAMLQGIAQWWTFLDDHPPVIVDALPWSGAFGGNVVLGIVLRHAGTLYVDEGGSSADRSERAARLRADVPPTIAFDVPFGWAAWADRLRGDDALRQRWLSRLDRACWSGATLSAATRDALRAISVPLASVWGSVETAGALALTDGVDPKYDAAGTPLAGVELKLIPRGDAYEARVRGAQVTNGYWWRPDLTAAAFDDEGFYRVGDLVRPLDARVPERGLELVGRVDDRFKRSSGGWVRAGALRERFLAECSDAAEVLVTGDGGEEIGLLVWPADDAILLERDVLRAQIAAAMRRVAAGDPSSGSPRRALIAREPLGSHERDECGALARRAVLASRAALVGRLHASEPDAEVIVV